MKRTDIEVGNEYGVVPMGAVQRRHGEVDRAQMMVRAKVLAVGEADPAALQKVSWRNRDLLREIVKCKVTKGYANRWKTAETIYVEPRKVICSWEDHEKALAERQEQYERQVNRQRELQEKYERDSVKQEALVKRLAGLGLSPYDDYNTPGVDFRFDPDQLEALIDRVASGVTA